MSAVLVVGCCPPRWRRLVLAPADDAGELRTVLFAGEYGSKDDPPGQVEVVGNLLSADGSVNFKGASIDVIPLQDGPTMILAQVLTGDQLALGKLGPLHNCSTSIS